MHVFVYWQGRNTHTHTHAQTHTHTESTPVSIEVPKQVDCNMCRFSKLLLFSFFFCKDGSDRLMKRASYSCCNFLCVVLAAAYLKYHRCRLSCLPFVWHLFFIVTHTHTHAQTHNHFLLLTLFLSCDIDFDTASQAEARRFKNVCIMRPSAWLLNQMWSQRSHFVHIRVFFSFLFFFVLVLLRTKLDQQQKKSHVVKHNSECFFIFATSNFFNYVSLAPHQIDSTRADELTDTKTEISCFLL